MERHSRGKGKMKKNEEGIKELHFHFPLPSPCYLSLPYLFSKFQAPFSLSISLPSSSLRI